MKYLACLTVALFALIAACSNSVLTQKADKGVLAVEVPDSTKWSIVRDSTGKSILGIFNKDFASLDIPGVDYFQPCEEDPKADLEKLSKLVVYPEMARRANIEGNVVVRVFIHSNGQPVRAMVADADSPMLAYAALKAAMKMNYTPAVYKGKYTGIWLNIPVSFRMK